MMFRSPTVSADMATAAPTASICPDRTMIATVMRGVALIGSISILLEMCVAASFVDKVQTPVQRWLCFSGCRASGSQCKI